MKIYKYELIDDINAPQLIKIPAKRILSVCEQYGGIVVYAEVDEDNTPEKEFLFQVCGTGLDMYAVGNPDFTYLGTVNLSDGTHMYHVYYAEMDNIDPEISKGIRDLYEAFQDTMGPEALEERRIQNINDFEELRAIKCYEFYNNKDKYAKYKKDVTTEVRAVLGDEIVEYAWQDCRYCNESKTSIINEKTIEPADGCPVIIRLKNGRLINIWASEWGGVTLLYKKEKESNLNKDRVLKILKDMKASSILDNVKIGLAGSFVQGQNKEPSDIDIVISYGVGSRDLEIYSYILSYMQSRVDYKINLKHLESIDRLGDFAKTLGLEKTNYNSYENILKEVIWIE